MSEGYRAARVDLADLLVNASAAMPDPDRAASLYGGVAERGADRGLQTGSSLRIRVAGLRGSRDVALQPDASKAWSWYQKGADAGEPNALARFAERDENNALAQTDPSKRNALLLQAFRLYAAAAERAHDEDWPDDAWKHWRYRRATLARLLAREGMMQQVADAYRTLEQPPHRSP